MDFPTKKYERGSNWSEPEVVELLQLWSDESIQLELESCLRNQHVFNRIAVALHERGIYRTADQCREKIKKLKLDYRRMKESQQTPRGARARRFYDVIDRVLSSRPPASSSSALWGNPGVHHHHHLLHHQAAPGSSSSAFTFSCPPKAGELMEIKLEELNADGEEELLSAEDPLCSEEEEEEEEEEEDCKSAGADAEDPGERGGGECAAYPGWSPSGFNDHPVAGSSAADVSPVPFPVTSVDRCTQADLKDPKYFSRFRQRKRRRAVRAGSSARLLEKALTSFINWQRVMEERYVSLEEMRLHQEARAERQREHQEERRVQQEREHELRLVTLLTGAFGAASGTAGQASSSTKTSDPSAAVSELTLLSVPPPSSPDPSTFPTGSRIQEKSSNMVLNTNAVMSVPSQSTIFPRILKDNQRGDEGNTSTTASDCSSATSDLSALSAPLSSSGPCPGVSTLPSVPSMLQGDQTPQHSNYLSRRGNQIRQHQGILQEGYKQYHANKYDENANPDGIVNLGTSENKLCFDLLQKRLTQPDMLYVDSCLLQYPDWKGHRFLREDVAEFLSEHCHAPKPLRADNVVVMNGCASLFSAIAAVLCDPEDAILIPTPFYGVIREDIDLYSSVKLYCVPLESEPSQNDDRPFHLTAGKLEHALQKAKEEGVNIKAVILVNPQNPLGDIYTPEEMISFLNCAKRHELHAVVDEIYMLSVFDGSFTSVLSLQRLPDPQRTHVMWGISKDFAMSGVRLGTIYSENSDLIEALDQLGNFHGVSGTTQHQVSRLLKDRDWMNKVFLPENRHRLQEAHQYMSTQLRNFDIPYLERGAGFFIWADFRKYLKEDTFAEELRIWRCFLKHRVLLSCGQAFSCSSPGWFRIIFSDQSHRLQLGLERIKATIEELQCSGIPNDSENTNADKQADNREMQRNGTTEDKNNKDDAKDTTIKAFNTTTKGHSESNGAVAESLLLADEDIQVNNYQAFANSESLDSLIGTLRQQIHSSDWLDKNRPKLSDGEDPTQAEVFKDLLDRARM